MAKKKRTNGTSKAGLIREYLEANPAAGNKDIERSLASSGVNYKDILNVRAALKKTAKGAKKSSPAAVPRSQPAKVPATATARASNSSASAVSAETLGKAVLFAKECGSVNAALAALQELRGLL